MSKSESSLVRGERLKVLVDYDLFDNNVNGESGIYLKTDHRTGKHLVYFPQFSEWAEILPDQVERENSGKILDEDLAFVNRVKQLVYTLEI